jgi:hypothetical protein
MRQRRLIHPLELDIPHNYPPAVPLPRFITTQPPGMVVACAQKEKLIQSSILSVARA